MVADKRRKNLLKEPIRITFIVILVLLACFPLDPSALAEETNCVASAHFVIHFENEPSQEVRQEIINFYENVASTLEEKFSSKLKDKVQLYLGSYIYSQAGDQMAFQMYDPSKPLFRFSCHEALHIILKDLLGPPPMLLFNVVDDLGSRYKFEELTVATFDLYFIRPTLPIHLFAAVLVKEKGFSFEETLSKGSGDVEPVISFLLYLLQNRSWDCFAKLWRYQSDLHKTVLENTQAAVLSAYGEELSSLEQEWKTHLEVTPISNEWLNTIKVISELHGIVPEKKKEWYRAKEEGFDGVTVSFSELPVLQSVLAEMGNLVDTGPYGLPAEPISNPDKVEQTLQKFKEIAEIVDQTIQLARLAQDEAKLGKLEASYRDFQKLRENLIRLGNSSYLSWVDNQLAELEAKVPPELVRKYINQGFPWWGWVLIGCGAAGILGLGGWFFFFRRGLYRKEKGQKS